MRSRMAPALAMLLAIFATGTIGYRLVEGASWWDSLYMTVITLTTVGYHEVFPLSHAGQIFTVTLLLAGLGVLLFVATEVARRVVEGELREVFGRARRTRMIERLTDHVIVCGWGRMGRTVVDEFVREGRALVVIEVNHDQALMLRERGVAVVEGDATSEATLRLAGVERARGLVVCLNDDAHNVYVVLTARSLNADLFIVARAGEAGAEERLRRAGADRVVNPYRLGGLHLAHVVTRPAAVELFEVTLGPGADALRIDQIRVAEGSPLAGRTLAESELRRKWGVGVVAVKRGSELLPNPEAAHRIEAGDLLIVVGRPDHLAAFERSR